MINVECHLFSERAILEIGSKEERESDRGDSGGYINK